MCKEGPSASGPQPDPLPASPEPVSKVAAEGEGLIKSSEDSNINPS